MSFILDALKKSEAERQRQNAPGIANIPESGRTARGSRWGLVIGGLLVLNLAVLAVIMLRPAEPTVTAGPAPRDAAPSLPPATESPLRPDPAAAASRTAEPALPAVAEPGAAAIPASMPPAPVADAPPSVTAALPSFAELRSQGVLSLPDMHLDIHVYSARPADRFVFVNMTKYTEGGRLAEGPAIREITPDGVVLDYLGTRFMLPRE